MPLFTRKKPQAVEQPPATLDLIYNEIKASLQESSAQAAALESKAGFVLTAASLLITIITTAQTTVSGRKERHFIAIEHSWWIVHKPSVTFTAAQIMPYLTIIAAFIYLWVVFYAWRGYMVRQFKIISPVILYDYIDPKYTQEWQVKKMLTHAMRDRYKINQEKVDLKSKQVEIALRGLLVEVIFIACMLLLLIFL